MPTERCADRRFGKASTRRPATWKRLLKSKGTWPETAAPAKIGCQPLLATDRFLMFSRQSTYLDFDAGLKDSFKFARGGCMIGVLPANGLAYVAPHACGCFTEAVRGFMGMTSTSTLGLNRDAHPGKDSLRKGPGVRHPFGTSGKFESRRLAQLSQRCPPQCPCTHRDSSGTRTCLVQQSGRRRCIVVQPGMEVASRSDDNGAGRR